MKNRTSIKIRFEGERIIWYKEKASQEYWSEHWKIIPIERVMEGSKRNKMLYDVFVNYLSVLDIVLDGGCGLSQWVKILKEKGYNSLGVDFSVDTVKTVKKYYPNLPLIIGDVLSLPFTDNCFDGYISLGVVEHFIEGPENAIKEAERVLKPGGLFFVSVPYFNFLRKIKKALHLYKEEESHSDDEFYQYAFTKGEFSQILKHCGFTPIESVKYGALKGLKDEISAIGKIYNKLKEKLLDQQCEYEYYRKNRNDSWNTGITKSLLKKLFDMGLMRKIAGHMVLFVAKVSKG